MASGSPRQPLRSEALLTLGSQGRRTRLSYCECAPLLFAKSRPSSSRCTLVRGGSIIKGGKLVLCTNHKENLSSDHRCPTRKLVSSYAVFSHGGRWQSPGPAFARALLGLIVNKLAFPSKHAFTDPTWSGGAGSLAEVLGAEFYVTGVERLLERLVEWW